MSTKPGEQPDVSPCMSVHWRMKSWRKPKAGKENYIFTAQLIILIQFIKRAEYVSRSPFLSKKGTKLPSSNFKYLLKLLFTSVGKGERYREKAHKLAKVTKLGEGIQWVTFSMRTFKFSFIYILDELQKLAAACASHICSSIVLPSSQLGKLYGFLGWNCFFRGGELTFNVTLSLLVHSIQNIMARTEYHLWLYYDGLLHPRSIIIISQHCYALVAVPFILPRVG